MSLAFYDSIFVHDFLQGFFIGKEFDE